MDKISLNGRTIALDFDGVLHSYVSGWTGEVPTDPPNDGAVAFCRTLIENGAKLVVYTTRAKTDEGLWATRSWLRQHGFPEMEVTAGKPMAIAYVDDRAVEFRGDWLGALEGIAELATLSSGKIRGPRPPGADAAPAR